MIELKVKPLTIWMLMNFIDNARSKDVLEVYHGTGTYFTNLEMSYLEGALCLLDEEAGDVYAIGGINDKGRIWMLCTSSVEKHPFAFLKFCKKNLDIYLKDYYMLWNYVWLGNEMHVNWLKWLGATFERVITVNNEQFQAFYFVNTKE